MRSTVILLAVVLVGGIQCASVKNRIKVETTEEKLETILKEVEKGELNIADIDLSKIKKLYNVEDTVDEVAVDKGAVDEGAVDEGAVDEEEPDESEDEPSCLNDNNIRTDCDKKNKVCKTTDGVAECVECKKFYELGGETDGCTLIDRCADKKDIQIECENAKKVCKKGTTPEAFECGICLPNYELDLNNECILTDQCTEGKGKHNECKDAHKECIQVVDTFVCDKCVKNYQDDGAGGCEEIPSCEPNKKLAEKCESQKKRCAMGEGKTNYECLECLPNFEGGEDDSVCTAMPVCRQKILDGKTGDEECLDRNAVCTEDADETKKYKCHCENGFKFDTAGQNCIEKPSCDEGKPLANECKGKNRECVSGINDKLECGQCTQNFKDNGKGICEEREKCGELYTPENGWCLNGIQVCNCGYVEVGGRVRDPRQMCTASETLKTECTELCGDLQCKYGKLDTIDCGKLQCQCPEGFEFNNKAGTEAACTEKKPCEDNKEGKEECDNKLAQCVPLELGKFECGACISDNFEKDGTGVCKEKDLCKDGTTLKDDCNKKNMECGKMEGVYKCSKCKEDFELNKDKACIAINQCETGRDLKNKCDLEKRKCEPKGTVYSCGDCIDNYELEDGVCKEVLLESECANGKTGKTVCANKFTVCVPAPGQTPAYTCGNCLEGYEKNSEVCEEKKPCAEGKDGKKECDLKNRHCQPEPIGKFKCWACIDGFAESEIDGECKKIPACELNNKEGKTECEAKNADCKEDDKEAKKYKCVCKNEFKDDGKGQCIEREKCADVMIPDNGFCNNGHVDCNCGYEVGPTTKLNTEICKAIIIEKEECASKCSSEGLCKYEKTLDKCEITCHCKEGSQLNPGKNGCLDQCQIKRENDKTATDLCSDLNANCLQDLKEPEKYRCVCKNDFKGDGKTKCEKREPCGESLLPDNAICEGGVIKCNCGFVLKDNEQDKTKYCQENIPLSLDCKNVCGKTQCRRKDEIGCVAECFCEKGFQPNNITGPNKECERIEFPSVCTTPAASSNLTGEEVCEAKEALCEIDKTDPTKYACVCEEGFEMVQDVCTAIKDGCKEMIPGFGEIGNKYCADRTAKCISVSKGESFVCKCTTEGEFFNYATEKCEGLDLCLEPSKDPNMECVKGKYQCKVEFETVGDKCVEKCSKIECVNSNCKLNAANEPECYCKTNFEKIKGVCTFIGCNDKGCAHKCTEVNEVPKCSCFDGFKLATNQIGCERDTAVECKKDCSADKHSVCVKKGAEEECECLERFEKSADGSKCEDKCTLGTFIPTVNCPGCVKTDDVNGYKCNCDTLLNFKEDKLKCIEINFCTEKDAAGNNGVTECNKLNAKCVRGKKTVAADKGYKCECSPGNVPRDTDELCIDNCEKLNCNKHNGATCVKNSVKHTAKCVCPTGFKEYAGKDCEFATTAFKISMSDLSKATPAQFYYQVLRHASKADTPKITDAQEEMITAAFKATLGSNFNSLRTTSTSDNKDFINVDLEVTMNSEDDAAIARLRAPETCLRISDEICFIPPGLKMKTGANAKAVTTTITDNCKRTDICKAYLNTECKTDKTMKHSCLCNNEHEPVDSETTTISDQKIEKLCTAAKLCGKDKRCEGPEFEKCLNLNPGYQCQCKDGFTNKNPHTCIPNCDLIHCENEGKCMTASGNVAFCECKVGFYGKECKGIIEKQELAAAGTQDVVVVGAVLGAVLLLVIIVSTVIIIKLRKQAHNNKGGNARGMDEYSSNRGYSNPATR